VLLLVIVIVIEIEIEIVLLLATDPIDHEYVYDQEHDSSAA
jgi:hypothetical protein